MKAKSVLEEVLLMALWAGDKLSKPTLRNLTEPDGAWEQRSAVVKQVQRMEERKLLTRQRRGAEIVCQLTNLGRLEALGGRDVVERWKRRWDGRWRQVLFDLPVSHRRVRMRLWRWLRENGFGYLQHSVWIHPDPVKEVVAALEEFRDDVESFVLMEATCCAGYSNGAVVNGAWDFDEINKRYESYIAKAELSRGELERLQASPELLGRWLRGERIAWQYALSIDPLLPRVLWPGNYRGEQAWETRRHCFRTLAEQFG